MVWSARDALKRVAIHRHFLHFGKKIRRERERERERDRQRDVRKWERESVCMFYIYRETQRKRIEIMQKKEKRRESVYVY